MVTTRKAAFVSAGSSAKGSSSLSTSPLASSPSGICGQSHARLQLMKLREAKRMPGGRSSRSSSNQAAVAGASSPLRSERGHRPAPTQADPKPPRVREESASYFGACVRLYGSHNTRQCVSDEISPASIRHRKGSHARAYGWDAISTGRGVRGLLTTRLSPSAGIRHEYCPQCPVSTKGRAYPERGSAERPDGARANAGLVLEDPWQPHARKERRICMQPTSRPSVIRSR
jgi:hypothetical protein